jgi:hypothetical protein
MMDTANEEAYWADLGKAYRRHGIVLALGSGLSCRLVYTDLARTAWQDRGVVQHPERIALRLPVAARRIQPAIDRECTEGELSHERGLR